MRFVRIPKKPLSKLVFLTGEDIFCFITCIGNKKLKYLKRKRRSRTCSFQDKICAKLKIGNGHQIGSLAALKKNKQKVKQNDIVRTSVSKIF